MFYEIDPSILHMRKLPKKVRRTLNGYENFIEHIKGYVWASDYLS